MDLYAELDVPRDADAQAVRKAYRRASKRAHPDGGGSAEKFRRVALALSVLSDANRRKHYDETGEIEEKPVDNAQAEILVFINAMFDKVLSELEQRHVPWECVNLVDHLLAIVNARRREIAQQKTQAKQAADKQRKLVVRFKTKKKTGDNRLATIMAGRVSYLEGMQVTFARQLETLDKVEEIIKGHTFEADAAPQQTTYYVRLG